MVIRQSLEPAIFSIMFPRTAVDIFIEIVQADGGTRCASITAASLALADAGVPLRDLVAGCAAGKIDDQIVLDLGKDEDNYGSADLPIAISPRTGEVLLLQMDGHLTQEEFDKAFDLVLKGCNTISEIQKKAILEKYESDQEGS